MKKSTFIWKRVGIGFVAIILGTIVVFGLMQVFNVKLVEQTEKLIHSYVTELQTQAVSNLNRNLENFIDKLELEADHINDISHPTDIEILNKLEKFSKDEEVKRVVIMLENGKVYTSHAGIHMIDPSPYHDLFNNDASTISQPITPSEGGEKMIYISSPLYLDSKKAGAIVSVYSSKDFKNFFSETAAKVGCYIELVRQDGEIIARSSDKGAFISESENIFDFFDNEEVDFINNTSLESLKSSFNETDSYWIKYTYKGDKRCANYTYSGMKDWYLGAIITDDFLTNQEVEISTVTFDLTLTILIVAAVIAFVLIRTLKKEKKAISNLKDAYNTAITNTNDVFFEADLEKGDFIRHSLGNSYIVRVVAHKNYPQAVEALALCCMPEYRQKFLDIFSLDNIKKQYEKGFSSLSLEYEVKVDNVEYWYSNTVVPISDETGKIERIMCVANDITAQKHERTTLEQKAYLDGLTQVLNKVSAEKEVDDYLAGEGYDKQNALLIFDIDKFKSVNDSLGHGMGDVVLKEYAAAVKNIIGKNGIVGRIGGDEFVALIKDYSNVEDVIKTAKLICSTVEKTYYNEDKSVSQGTSASIGISIYKEHGGNFAQLYKAADLALYESKEEGRNTFRMARKVR